MTPAGLMRVACVTARVCAWSELCVTGFKCAQCRVVVLAFHVLQWT